MLSIPKNSILFGLSSFLAITCFSSSSMATTADSCNALLTVGIHNVTQGSSAEESESLAKSTFCSADYSSNTTSSETKASISGSYGIASGSASGSYSDEEIKIKQTQLCTSGFNSSAYSSQASAYSKTIYQGALDAWNQCNALSGKGLNFEIQSDSGMQGVTVTLSAASTGTSSKFLGLTQLNTGRSSCKTTLPARGTSLNGRVITVNESTSFNFDSSSKLTIVCKRQMKNDGADNLSADAQTLVFNTSVGAYNVPMVAVGTLAHVPFDQAMGQIRDAVDKDTQTSLSTVNSTLTGQASTLSGQAATLSGAVASNVSQDSWISYLNGKVNTITNAIDDKRQSFESSAASNKNATVSIPEQTIAALCGDSDGCSLRMGMYNWDGTGRTASRNHLFYYNTSNKAWRDSNDQAGTNGNGSTEHPIQDWECIFTDGKYTNGVDNGDSDSNFGLLNWGLSSVGSCKLTIID